METWSLPKSMEQEKNVVERRHTGRHKDRYSFPNQVSSADNWMKQVQEMIDSGSKDSDAIENT